MKNRNAKKPTKKQRIFLSSYHLNYNDWLVMTDNADKMKIIHRNTGTIKHIPKRDTI